MPHPAGGGFTQRQHRLAGYPVTANQLTRSLSAVPDRLPAANGDALASAGSLGRLHGAGPGACVLYFMSRCERTLLIGYACATREVAWESARRRPITASNAPALRPYPRSMSSVRSWRPRFPAACRDSIPITQRLNSTNCIRNARVPSPSCRPSCVSTSDTILFVMYCYLAV